MLRVLFLSHLILFKYHLFTFKYTHLIIFKTQEYLCLPIFKKPMIQVHDKTNFINGIQIHNRRPWFKLMTIHSKPNSHWQYQKLNSHWQHQSPTLIGNIKAQFLLSISKAQFSLALLYQKEKSPRLSTLGKEKISCYHSKKGSWQSSYEETH